MSRIWKSEWGRFLRVGLIVGIVAIGIRLAWPQPRLLLERAHPIGRVQIDDHWEDESAWLSEEQLLILTADQHTDRSAGWRGKAELLNVTTGARTPLEGLTALLNRPRVSPNGTPWSFELSPDGSWLIWINDTTDPTQNYGAAHLDGTCYRGWKIDNVNAYDSFFVDDRHWGYRMAKRPDKLTILDLLDAKQDRTYPVTAPPAKDALARRVARSPTFVDFDRSWAREHAQLAIYTYRTQDAFEVLNYNCCSATKTPVPLQRHSIKLPKGAFVMDKGADKTNACVYYDLQIAATSPFLEWLHRTMPRFTVPTTVTEALWVSRSDGQDFHEVGHLRASRIEKAYKDRLKSVEWSPNGKQIRFTYKNTLYVVDAKNE